MKFSEKWLREWVDPPVSTEELVERLTMAGLEVDSVEPAAPAFSKVVVGEVLSVEPHPDADKLRVCSVNVGEQEPLQIVCGAPNVAAGTRYPTALVGGCLPGDFKIKKAKLRGVESRGMLCSGRELGLSDDHKGIMPLPVDAPVGKDVREYLDLDDAVIDIDLTPNRGDCLGIEGVAREVGALTKCAVTSPDMPAAGQGCEDVFPVVVADAEACPRYLGRVIRGIRPGATTPSWMQEKLRRSGLRSIDPVVDVTNYVLLELGQPLHAFDLHQLQDRITVRMAEEGEKLVLLDGNQVDLDPGTLVIADQEKVLAMAGIMGGEHSGVTASTTELFLECAFFRPETISGRARRYGLQTDSSFRFERGVDPGLQHRALERATGLLLDIVGGSAGPVIDVSSPDQLPRRPALSLRSRRLERVLGIAPSSGEVEDILTRLGMNMESREDGWAVTPPGFRFDVAIEADLIEEVARVYGYNRLPSTVPAGRIEMAPVPESRVTLESIRATLVERGYQEAITYSFVAAEDQALLDPDREAVVLANPISSEMSVMRTTLWAGLLRTAQFNLHRQQQRVRLFEQGLRFINTAKGLVQEPVLAGVVVGGRYEEQWAVKANAADFFDVLADVEALLDLGGRADDFRFEAATHPALHPGQCARVFSGDIAIGWIGALHPETAGRLDLPESICVFEIEQEALREGRLARFSEISKYPSIRRDLALVVDRDVTAEAVRGEAERAGKGLVKQTVIFDVYEGEGIESARKSLALGLILQDSRRTLTDAEVKTVMDQVTAHLGSTLGAQLRE